MSRGAKVGRDLCGTSQNPGCTKPRDGGQVYGESIAGICPKPTGDWGERAICRAKRGAGASCSKACVVKHPCGSTLDRKLVRLGREMDVQAWSR